MSSPARYRGREIDSVACDSCEKEISVTGDPFLQEGAHCGSIWDPAWRGEVTCPQCGETWTVQLDLEIHRRGDYFVVSIPED